MTKIFGSKYERDWKNSQPLIEEVKRFEEDFVRLTGDGVRAKTEEFRQRIKDEEPLDNLLPEAFGLVKAACRHCVGKEYTVCGHKVKWDMVPFDVQVFGGIMLHKGFIAEMATGEGKTLVATMPLYLNALTGKGAHLVTVNDYLARRDREWMGIIYEYLGLTVDAIQNEMDSAQRRIAYGCDITYGTNNEFGFDYLRDNMAIRMEERVQRGHYYAIVDEVDSVLIDEARTPLIISGPVGKSSHHLFDELKPRVEAIARRQRDYVNQLLNEAQELINQKQEYEAGVKLLQVERGAPKNKRLLKLYKETGIKKLITSVENDYIREKKLPVLDEELYYAIDEKQHSINLSEKGRLVLSPGNKDMFLLPDLPTRFHEIDTNPSFSQEEKVRYKEKAEKDYIEISEKIHSINQLLKAYSLFEKDVEYVVSEGKVLIVDEFTGRLMPGRRFSEGLHQALEAKEGVQVEGETQTFATITLQNYFRMYEKLAGMTGTAETEAEEFYKIYKLDVEVIPTNEPVRRIDYNDVIYRTRREKYASIIEEIERVNKLGRPVLVGTISVDVSETLSRMLKRTGIRHSVLNAKYHEKEADIVRDAGQNGAVTIATNMAGRGTDIKLGDGVVRCRRGCAIINDDEESGDNMPEGWTVEDCRDKMPCGLHIIGTERHESRRIDRQLRGRSGRQGDPGSSRFYLSLEDDLMRLFGSTRIASVMDRLGVKEGEVIEHQMITKAIERAQKRVEGQNFGIRKQLIEYDDVMNQQREVIYAKRTQGLEGENLKNEIVEILNNSVEKLVDEYIDPGAALSEREFDGIRDSFKKMALSDIPREILEIPETEEIKEKLKELLLKLYENRENELGQQLIRDLERYVWLQVIDQKWKEHLYDMDHLKGGIGLRAYGQKDPLIEYKTEGYKIFLELLESIDKDIATFLFRARFAAAAPQQRMPEQDQRRAGISHERVSAFARAVGRESPDKERQRLSTNAPDGSAPPKQVPVRVEKKVGRNDPCPCGSGKKYKKCCGQGV